MARTPAAARGKSQEVATVADNEYALPAELMEEYAGMEQEELGREDLSLPFLRILQTNSPQVNKRDPKYVKGAEAGMFMNTATLEVFDGETGITVVPCAYQRTFVEWIPRNKGGGFVTDHGLDNGTKLLATCRKGDPSDPKDKKLYLPKSGNQLVETAYHFLMLVQGEQADQVICAMSSSALKVSRNWNTRITNVRNPQTGARLPRFVMAYKLTTVQQQNEDGSWFNYAVEPQAPSMKLFKQQDKGRAFLDAAKNFATQMQTFRVVPPADEAEATEETDAHY